MRKFLLITLTSLALYLTIVSLASAQQLLFSNYSMRSVLNTRESINNQISSSTSILIDTRSAHAEKILFILNGVSYEGSRNPSELIDPFIRDTHDYYVRASKGIITARGASASSKAGEYLFVSAMNKTTKKMSMSFSIQTPNGRLYSIDGSLEKPVGYLLMKERGLTVSDDFTCPQSKSLNIRFDSGFKGENDLTTGNNAETYAKNPIRLLTAYTNGVLDSVEGDKGVVISKISAELLKLNETFINSGLQTTVELACDPIHLTQQGVEAVGAAVKAMEDGDGMWDEIHASRKSCSADLVHVFIGGKNYTGAGGFGLIPPSASVESARWGFSASYLWWLPGINKSSSFTHEIGHNLGAGHANTNEGDELIKLGLLDDSKGFRFIGSDKILYRTIMAYAPGERFWGFSNPEITHAGVPTGIKDLYDNSKVVKLMTDVVSEYRNNLSMPEGGSFSVSLRRVAEDPATYVDINFSPSSQTGLDGQFVKLWRAGISEEAPHKKNIIALASATMSLPIQEGKGQHYISLYPSISFKSEIFEIPDLNSATITLLKGQGSVLNGNISTGSTLKINGDWLSVYRYEGYSSVSFHEMNVHPDINGDFSFNADKPGIYQVRFSNQEGKYIKSNFVVIS